MHGMLDKLQSPDAILLMYLAGELSEEDRLGVERMLANDGALRRRLDDLLELDSFVRGQVEIGVERAPVVSDDAAARRIGREMRRYQLELAGRPAPALAPKAAPVSSWWYGAAAVAAGVVLFIGLWGTGIIELPISTQMEGLVDSSLLPTEDPEAMAASFAEATPTVIVDVSDLTRTIEGEPSDGLDEARLHVVELEALADAAVPLF